MATLKSIKNKYLTPSDGTVLGVTTNTENISALSFKLATADSLSKFNMVDGFTDDYNDATGVDGSASSGADRNATGNYYSGTGTQIAAFNSSGNWTAPSNITGTTKILVVAGGGGGSGDGYSVGGSGAGGVVEIPAYVTVASSTYAITVGSGGAYMPFPWTSNGNPGPNNGVGNTGVSGNSVFDTASVGTGPITAIAGGVGRSFSYRDSDWPGGTWVSGAGGSGGGGGGSGPHGDQQPGGGTAQPTSNGGFSATGFGFAGGRGETSNPPGGAGGGGGGAGAVGGAGTAGGNGPGGDAGAGRLVSWATAYGDEGYFGGGGGGGSGGSGQGGEGGKGGGGAGGSGGFSGAPNAYPNTALSSGIDASVTVIPVNDLSSWPVQGTFQIGTATNKLNEIVTYTGKSVGSGAGNFTGCTRGKDYTSAISHATGATIYVPPQGGCGLPNTGGGGGGSKNDNYGASGGSGVVLVEYSTLGNMTLASNAFTAQTAPTTARIILDEESAAGATTLNTDIKAYASRDNGTTFTQMTLASQADTLVTGGIDANTKLMLHMDGVNAGTTFTDSSPSLRTVTVVGSAQTSTTQSKFSGSSGYFATATGNYLTLADSADLEFGGGDFTLDCWVYPTAATRNAIYAGSSDYWFGIDFHAQQGTVRNISIWASSNGSSWDLLNADAAGNGIGGISLTLDQWSHIAIVRSGDQWMSFINGVKDINVTVAGTITDKAEVKRIGQWGTGSFVPMTYMDEFRIIKGVAAWTENFTVPNSPYSTGSYSGPRRLLSGSVDISGQPAGTNMKYKITTHNQAVAKQTRVYGTSMAWA